MARTPPPTLTDAPADEPQRGVKDTFSDLVDDFVTWMSNAPAQFRALALNVYNNAVDAFASAGAAATSASSAATSEANAAASAAAASVTAGATLWVSGQTVAQDAAKISPLDRRTYRRKTATGSGTIDPASDSTNYVLLSAGMVPYIYVRDEKPSGTVGGGASNTSWNFRTLNATKANTIAGASMGGGQITLPAGTYEYDGSAPANRADRHQVRLYNVTDATVVDVGTSECTDYGLNATSRSVLRGTLTISATKIFELQHYLNAGGQTYSLGMPVSSGSVEVYTEIRFRKIA